MPRDLIANFKKNHSNMDFLFLFPTRETPLLLHCERREDCWDAWSALFARELPWTASEGVSTRADSELKCPTDPARLPNEDLLWVVGRSLLFSGTSNEANSLVRFLTQWGSFRTLSLQAILTIPGSEHSEGIPSISSNRNVKKKCKVTLGTSRTLLQILTHWLGKVTAADPRLMAYVTGAMTGCVFSIGKRIFWVNVFHIEPEVTITAQD